MAMLSAIRVASGAKASPPMTTVKNTKPTTICPGVNTCCADIAGSSSANSNTARCEIALSNAACTAHTIPNFDATTKSICAPQRCRAASTVSGPGSAVAISKRPSSRRPHGMINCRA
jgi:hypothetical protein